MKISEVSIRTQLSKDTIRYYEKLGLIRPQVIHHHRDYSESDVRRLNEIKLLKHASFSLKEVMYFISLDDKFQDIEAIYNMSDEDYSTLISLITRKQKEIDDQIRSLQIAKQSLTAMNTKLNSLGREQ
ncbi:MerR family transcriptional regulator [Macrococcus brunensis]|uniref:helix-turn-helix domain-containing protein n=1 Tax=Macrococcus brunensis TaxID=198483 RepID=UPI001EF0DE7C|nr:MerR family transcriptional regulator [Macrococcus brunensis]ULG72231.1 MerR family transcriptional regulator [Macrococcus brunensis]